MKTSIVISVGGLRLNIEIACLGLQARTDVLNCLVQAVKLSGMEQGDIDNTSQTLNYLREELIRSSFHLPKQKTNKCVSPIQERSEEHFSSPIEEREGEEDEHPSQRGREKKEESASAKALQAVFEASKSDGLQDVAEAAVAAETPSAGGNHYPFAPDPDSSNNTKAPASASHMPTSAEAAQANEAGEASREVRFVRMPSWLPRSTRLPAFSRLPWKTRVEATSDSREVSSRSGSTLTGNFSSLLPTA